MLMKIVPYLLRSASESDVRAIVDSRRLVIQIRSDHFGHIVNQIDFFQRLIQEPKIFVLVTKMSLDAAIVDYFISPRSRIVLVAVPAKTTRIGRFFAALRLKLISVVLLFIATNRFIANGDFVYRVALLREGKSKIVDPAGSSKRMRYYAPVYQKHLHRTIVNPDLVRSKMFKTESVSLIKELLGSEAHGRIVGLKLRKVIYSTNNYHDTGRNSSALEDYRWLIEHLTAKGYFVLLDPPHEYKEWHSRDVVNIASFGVREAGLLRLYLLTRSFAVLQPHSGPVHLCNICDVPNIVIDSFPFWQGTWSERDFIVPRTILDLDTGHEILLSKAIKSNRDVFLGKYDLGRFRFGLSRRDDIESAIEEFTGGHPKYYFSACELERARRIMHERLPRVALNSKMLSKFPEAMIYREVGPLSSG